MRFVPAVATILVALSLTAGAQDAHYWHKQYGNRAYLLGGAVIGSADDASAVYYNPALLTATDRRDLTVTGNAYRVARVSLANALGPGKDLATQVIGVAPSLVAGSLPFGDGQDDRLADALVFRHDFNVVLELRGAADLGGILDDANVRLGYEENVNEVWGGFSYAHYFGRPLSAGISVFTTYRTHRSRRASFTAAEREGEFGIAVQRDDVDYNYIGLLARLGVGGQAGAWRYGLTLTPPVLRLTGHGAKSVDRVVAVASEAEQILLEYLASDTQKERPVHFRTPLAVGAGLSWQHGGTGVHLSAEWFDAIKSYILLDTSPAVAGQSGDVFEHDLTAASRSVLNWGVGVEQRLGPRLAAYASYHTDFSTVSEKSSYGPLSIWDIDHYAAGLSLRLGDKRVVTGVVLARGDEPVSGSVDLLPGDLDESGITGLPRNLEARYRSFMLLLGFNTSY